MKRIITLIFAAVLIAGCTQRINVDLSALEDLGELPQVNASGMNELGSLPPANMSIDLGSGIPSDNPFPSQPELE